MSLPSLPPIADDDDDIAHSIPVACSASMADVTVPAVLQMGTPMIKVSGGKQKNVVFRLDPDQGQIIWESKKHRIIPIENIKELRTASDARYYRELFQLSQECENRWLTIIYTLDGRWKIWHVIAPSVDVFQMWDSTLHKLYAVRQTLMRGLGNFDLREALWAKQYWKAADEQADQKLYFEDVKKLCKRLNVNSSRDDLYRHFQQADVQRRGFLKFDDFKCFVKLLKARPEVKRLHEKLCSLDKGSFSFRTFERFMRDHQKSNANIDELKRLFLHYATPSPDNGVPKAVQTPPDLFLDDRPDDVSPAPNRATPEDLATASLSLGGFTAFLLSTSNSAFTDQDGSIHQDMTRPLSDYYVSSSHNTYLVGHQLVGDSTIEGYIRALLHSCRSVELDIFDGDKEPVVYHGKTLTTKVPLRKACEAIAKYAFVVSPYPIIISAEVHCSIPQQDMIASIMREVFGDSLVSAPVQDRPKITVLPSPEDLKGCILLKTKNLYVSENEEMQPNAISVDVESSTTSTEATTDGEMLSGSIYSPELRQNPLREGRRYSEASQGVTRPQHVLSRHSPSNPVSGADKMKVRMSMSLLSLLVYTVGVKCRGINKKEHYAPEHMFSLSENTANKMFKRDGMIDLIKHNRTHLVRVYPKGMRVSSTNFVPQQYWSAGIQLVALNWQTYDLGYTINHAMFQRNGRSGYVLKPLALRSQDKSLLNKQTRRYLDITVISAQQLPLPKDANGHEIVDKQALNPYVEVSVHFPDWGLYSSPPSSSTSALQVSNRTSTVKNNGFNPIWDETLSLPFHVLGDMRELVFVRFAVREDGDDDNEALAVHCVSLACLREGFRHLPLYDAHVSQYLFSTLFVRIKLRDDTN
ncbi:PLC-like phosphodiesterase [Russula emetica]|nr:PLC-like phosphodiesterase [Russula emetica]